MNLDKNKFAFVKPDNALAEKISAPNYSYWGSVRRKFFSNKINIIMLAIMLVIVLTSFIQPMFSHYNFMEVSNINDFSTRYNLPNLHYWFGTDANGQSLFDVVWAGAKTSILIGVIGTVITVIIGLIVGAIWGISKKIDRFMLEVYNIISNVPTILIVILLSYVLGAGFWNLVFAMCCTSWVGEAFFIRIQVMMIRDREYNLASKTLGTPNRRIIIKNILPFLISVVVTNASRMLPGFIGMEVFLSFLGVGLSPDVPSLGRVISQYTNNLANYPYLFWIPVFILALINISLYLVGQALADASDPRTHF